MQPVEYYQIGGFRAHLRDNSNDALTAKLMTGDGVEAEFVLGIRPCGASYLLLPRDRFIRLRLGRPRDMPWRAYDFESLSPVQFATKVDLTHKFSVLASNKKTGDGPPRDRSKANTAYTAGGEGLSGSGIARSFFEHQRVFYRLCQRSIQRPLDYALSLAPWFRQIRIFSFAFNTWGSDNRSLPEREDDPRIMDVSWTEFNTPTDSCDLSPLSTCHYVVEEERFLGNPGRKKLSLPDVTQNMPRARIATFLQALLAPPPGAEAQPPILLLVHDEKMTRCALRSFGVDASRWRVGIKDLLYSPDPRGPPKNDAYHDSKRDVRDYAKKWSRSRSPSPRRQSSTDCAPRARSPPPTRAPPPVYLVDVRQMYHTLMEIPRNDTVLANSISLGVKDTAPLRGEDDRIVYEDVDLQSWCAGRESRLIGYMWEEMANSVAIDEQRALRHRFSEEDLIADYPPASGAAADNEDFDPNDIIQQPQAHSGGSSDIRKPVGMYDSASEDDDW
ncbi:hypothetical protein BC628DRAFT_1387505 [Trametes gibbosa]|nr:hypothetical protein BC628DRAFT_1387505 [Trametes gibbosa]